MSEIRLRAFATALLPLLLLSAVCGPSAACPVLSAAVSAQPAMPPAAPSMDHGAMPSCHRLPASQPQAPQPPPDLKCCCRQLAAVGAAVPDVPVPVAATVDFATSSAALLAGHELAPPAAPPRWGPGVPLFTLHQTLLI